MWMDRPRGKAIEKELTGYSLFKVEPGRYAIAWILGEPFGRLMHFDTISYPCETADESWQCHCTPRRRSFRRWYFGIALGYHGSGNVTVRASPLLPRHTIELPPQNLKDLGDADLAGARIRIEKPARGSCLSVRLVGRDDLRNLPAAFDVQSSMEGMWNVMRKRPQLYYRTGTDDRTV